MHTGFYHIRRIDEESGGLRVTVAETPAGFLPNDHPQFHELRGLLRHQHQEMQSQGVPRPTWLALDDNRIIREVRMVGKSVPLSANRDESGAYLIVFPLTNRKTQLKPDHPRFHEFERTLLFALEHQTPLYYVTSPGNVPTIIDMVPLGA